MLDSCLHPRNLFHLQLKLSQQKKIRKVSCGILWWYTFWGIRVSYLLAKREVPQFCLEKWREQMVSFWPSRPLSDRSRSISQPFTTEGLANPDHPRSIVQAKASLLDSFRNQRQSGQSWSRTLRKRGIQKHQILNVSRVQIYMSFIEFPYLGFPSH